MIDIKSETQGYVAHGVSACAGCGMELIIRNILDVLGDDTTVVIPPGCSALFCGFGKETALKIPAFQGNLENSAAYATGIRAGYRAQGNNHTTVLVYAGDGGTLDIGLQSLSGMMERGEDVLYVCYDNEAYMNTGIQGSSATPFHAWSTTTPAGKNVMKKDLLSIAIAHRVPYCASCSMGNIPDLRHKFEKAKSIQGPRVIHVFSPCPTGWGIKPAKSVEVSRMAIQTGMWILYEYEYGKLKVNIKPKSLEPICTYLKMQKRFKQVTDEQMEELQQLVTANYNKMLKMEKI
ncbi:thiamine pyrophosphate-dependent enzyme [Megasphaera paucivorans]|uniref:Ketoisovalerate ferredoxin oxidoreductase, beta subunit n=1 Tax=Megasphaera paucivorans TaxID=349095 RepID=A0A1H0B894_9FIRM|nr:thiamine pyrophosphate-dependent enzyme [Megasphaera paucivorans]SDN41856.1 ketoisovalerate ferredoxin oxidoreductase, beta subunit [Megasphaera paucivorans]